MSMMSLSALERGNPPPRRKSCTACIKAKRRCDIGFPSCLRCTHRKIECVYSPTNSGGSGMSSRAGAPRSKRQLVRGGGGGGGSGGAGGVATGTGTGRGTGTGTGQAIPQQQNANTANATGSNDAIDFHIDSLVPDAHNEMDWRSWPGPISDIMQSLDDFQHTLAASPSTAIAVATPPGVPDFLLDDVDIDSIIENILPCSEPTKGLELLAPPVPVAPTQLNDLVVAFRDPCCTAEPLSVAHLFRTRLVYAVGAMRRAPATFVRTTGTPWMHPSLYRDGMPAAVEEAHAACALYAAKNEGNAAVIMRCVESRLAALLAAGPPPLASSSSSSPYLRSSSRDHVGIPTSSFEALAYTQALLLYQIMRVLDDGIASRAEGAPAEVALEEATIALMGHLSFDDVPAVAEPAMSFLHARPVASPTTPPTPGTSAGEYSSATPSSLAHVAPSDTQLPPPPPPPREPREPLPLFPLSATKAFWARWAFRESSRRTFLMAFFFTQLARLLRGRLPRSCDGRIAMCHSWTLSARLWRATDPVAFAEAWNDPSRDHFVVTPLNLGRALEETQPDDFEEFGKILLTTIIGVDETRGWFASKGGEL